MTNLLAGIMIVVTVWAVLATRAYSQETRSERDRADGLLQQLIAMAGENRVLTDQAKYYKAIGEKFLNNPVVAMIQDEQMARLADTVTRGLAAAVCKGGSN